MNKSCWKYTCKKRFFCQKRDCAFLIMTSVTQFMLQLYLSNVGFHSSNPPPPPLLCKNEVLSPTLNKTLAWELYFLWYKNIICQYYYPFSVNVFVAGQWSTLFSAAQVCIASPPYYSWHAPSCMCCTYQSGVCLVLTFLQLISLLILLLFQLFVLLLNSMVLLVSIWFYSLFHLHCTGVTGA